MTVMMVLMIANWTRSDLGGPGSMDESRNVLSWVQADVLSVLVLVSRGQVHEPQIPGEKRDLLADNLNLVQQGPPPIA
jgi:hypothetical protein